MKIGIESQRIFRPGKHGMEVVALELIRQIQRLDTIHEYILFAKNDKDRGCITETSRFATHTISSVSYADWEQIGLPVALRKTKPHFIHCTANTAPLICPVPLLLTLHDIIYLEQTDFGGSSYQNFGNLYRRMVVPSAIRRSRTIITVSEYEKNLIIAKCKVPPEKVRVIYNGVDARFHQGYSHEQTDAFRHKYQLPDECILFLGNTAPKKNTFNTIRAYAEYCDNSDRALPLVITDYDRRNAEKILVGLSRASLIGKFVFPGYIPSDEMPLMYNCASLFLYPSLRESFGLPVLEAMACGVPVITSNTSAIPEIAEGAALLANPLNYREIGAAMSDMLSDGGLRDQYIQKGFARAARFNWENSAKKLLEIYNEF